jgi:hypothetical protein
VSNDAKDQLLQIRLSTADRVRSKSLAATLGVSESEAVRRLINGRELTPPPPPLPVCDDRMVTAIRKIGVNLNQIAHELNARTRQEVTGVEFIELNQALGIIAAAILGGPDAVARLRGECLTDILARPLSQA